ncbi:MAG: hypothetical protein MMC33_004480 [Icmadophila ericetorum]|nr:hypothetical protein [Icmadophila ericetorum]
MPRPGLPPTPASSTDILGKDDVRGSSNELSFALPPPAIASSAASTSSNDSVKSDSSYHPVSPTSPVAKKQRRTANIQLSSANADFSLPPPPTRSRKIIQMKPGPAPDTKSSYQTTGTVAGYKRGGLGSSAAGKKTPSTTSAAGRKIARKTAHSLIERRRRSKMNEEFGVLKDMIPACRDQEMHKLAILQASIDYLRYLEQCVADLKAANGSFPPNSSYQQQRLPPQQAPTRGQEVDEDDEDDDEEDSDQEMADSPSTSTNVSPAIHPLNTQSQNHSRRNTHSSSTTTSPALLANVATPRQQPSSYQTSTMPSPSFRPQSQPHSSLPSPAFLPQNHSSYHTSEQQHSLYGTPNAAYTISPTITSSGPGSGGFHSLYRSTSHSAGPSPNLIPLPESMATVISDDADQEATAALLMLNTERRGTSSSSGSVSAGGSAVNLVGFRDLVSGGAGGRGMSVRDLLSS